MKREGERRRREGEENKRRSVKCYTLQVTTIADLKTIKIIFEVCFNSFNVLVRLCPPDCLM